MNEYRIEIRPLVGGRWIHWTFLADNLDRAKIRGPMMYGGHETESFVFPTDPTELAETMPHFEACISRMQRHSDRAKDLSSGWSRSCGASELELAESRVWYLVGTGIPLASALTAADIRFREAIQEIDRRETEYDARTIPKTGKGSRATRWAERAERTEPTEFQRVAPRLKTEVVTVIGAK